METKVNKRHEIPAGILHGVEIFTHEGQIFGLENGTRKPFDRLSTNIQQAYMKKFIADRKFHRYAKQQWKLETFSKVFFKWMDCAFGSLDGTPDINMITGETTRDENSWCGDCNCALAGINCKLPYGLKVYEVETIRLFKQGKTARQIAHKLHRSQPAIISRIEKSKIQLGAVNMAHLSSLTPLVS